jgi:type IV secretory pathway TrbD component
MQRVVRPGARALNKPMLIVGIDRKLAGVAFLLAVIIGANDGFVPKTAAPVVFLALWAVGRRLTAKDSNIFAVMNQVRHRKALYDPLKCETFRVSIQEAQ